MVKRINEAKGNYMYWLIENTLKESDHKHCLQGKKQYVAVITPDEWQKKRNDFDMGIDIDFETEDIHTTMAEVNYDSITGSFVIPRLKGTVIEYEKFAFALDEKGIVFIDNGNNAYQYIDRIIKTRKWRTPSLERFIYDFLEEIIRGDLTMLEQSIWLRNSKKTRTISLKKQTSASSTFSAKESDVCLKWQIPYWIILRRSVMTMKQASPTSRITS